MTRTFVQLSAPRWIEAVHVQLTALRAATLIEQLNLSSVTDVYRCSARQRSDLDAVGNADTVDP